MSEKVLTGTFFHRREDGKLADGELTVKLSEEEWSQLKSMLGPLMDSFSPASTMMGGNIDGVVVYVPVEKVTFQYRGVNEEKFSITTLSPEITQIPVKVKQIDEETVTVSTEFSLFEDFYSPDCKGNEDSPCLRVVWHVG